MRPGGSLALLLGVVLHVLGGVLRGALEVLRGGLGRASEVLRALLRTLGQPLLRRLQVQLVVGFAGEPALGVGLGSAPPISAPMPKAIMPAVR